MKKNDQISEKEFLKNYNADLFERPNASVDTVIYTIIENTLQVLLVKREHHPFKGLWSLVGGYIDLDNDKDLYSTARRKLEEKTGVKTPYLEQFYTIGNKTRDPRGWSVTTVYFALIPAVDITLKAGKGASDIKWSPVDNGDVLDRLAFDHRQILKDCTERLRRKVLYTSLPLYLMGDEFTLVDLQTVYEIILGYKIEHKSFRRRILGADLVYETGRMKETGRRPAMLYRKKESAETYFFLRNLEGPHQ